MAESSPSRSVLPNRTKVLDDGVVIFGSGEGVYLEPDTTQTNDAIVLWLGSDMSRTLLIADNARRGDNYALASQTNPTLAIFSATAASVSTTQYVFIQHNATDAIIRVGTGSIRFQDGSGNPLAGISGSPLEIRGEAPELRLTETDQTSPAGQWRLNQRGDVLYLERQQDAGNWDTAVTLLQIDPYTANNFALEGANFSFVGASAVTSTRILGATGENAGATFNLTGSRITSAFSGQVKGARAGATLAAANTQNWTDTVGFRALDSRLVVSDNSNTFTITGAAAIYTGIFSAALNSANVTFTNLYGVYIANPPAITAGTVTNLYGIKLEDITRGGTINVSIALGTDNDIGIYHNPNTLAANTALGGLTVGTVVGAALAANSLIVSNITAAGDVAFYGNRGGNSEQFLFYDVSAGVLYLMANFGGVMLGLAADPPAPDQAGVHIWDGTVGAVTAVAGSLLTIEAGAANTYLTIMASGGVITGIHFGDGGGSNVGRFIYDHALLGYSVWIESVERLRWTSGAFAFQEATTISSTSVGQLIFNGGLMIGVNAAANQIDDASNGAGSTTTYIGNASINVTSDVRVKENILPYQGDALALIRRLQVKEFDYLDAARPFGGVYTGRYVGFTAQDLYQVAPWSVNTQGGADCWECRAGLPCDLHLPWQARYEFLNGLLVKGIQELADDDALFARIEQYVNSSPENKARLMVLVS